jgi:hypothetical protein
MPVRAYQHFRHAGGIRDPARIQALVDAMKPVRPLAAASNP